MKKFVITVMVLFFATASGLFAQSIQKKGGATLKGGFDINGDNDVTYNIKSDGESNGTTISETGDVDSGLTISAEYLVGINEMVAIGIGGTYQVPRGVDEDWPAGKFNFANAYGILNIVFNMQGSTVSPFVPIHIGYGYLMADSTLKESIGSGREDAETFNPAYDIDVKGGIYWGVGFGLLFDNNIQVELLYNVNNGEMKYKTGGETSTADFTGTTLEFEYTKLSITVGYKF